jgi:hypothetical protein
MVLRWAMAFSAVAVWELSKQGLFKKEKDP